MGEVRFKSGVSEALFSSVFFPAKRDRDELKMVTVPLLILSSIAFLCSGVISGGGRSRELT